MAGIMSIDTFEQLVGEMFEANGWWIRRNVLLGMPAEAGPEEEKRPARRCQLDLVAYKPSDGIVLAIECKAYLDSRGIGTHNLTGSARSRRVLRLFNDRDHNAWVGEELKRRYQELGLCRPGDRVRFALACARIVETRRDVLEAWFRERDFELVGPERIASYLRDMGRDRGGRTAPAVAARLLMGNPAQAEPPEQSQEA